MKTAFHEKYMRRCIDLARQAEATVRPNPMVGAVVVHRNEIIGEGYHRRAGTPHAEVVAIESVAAHNLHKLKEAVLYVNLEPCAHYGKTPPCALRIISEEIKTVIVGCIDSFPEVAGRGIDMLRSAGVEVVTGVMESECHELNRRFFTFHSRHRPYIILKWAQTGDGFIDIERPSGAANRPVWITGNEARRWVHLWRGQEQAIMVGAGTARMDNPLLTVRNWSGTHPLRVVLSRSGSLPDGLALFDGETPTLVFTYSAGTPHPNTEYVVMPKNRHPVNIILETLFQRGVQSLIVEGGAQLLTLFIEMNLWDEARVFIGESLFVKGVKAPRLQAHPIAFQKAGNSRLLVYRNR